jgi:hypothetical protein
MEYCLERNLTIGMLENSGAERRHEIGRVQFKKALSGGAGEGKAFRGTKAFENRSAYLTLRGLLIWQYGRDMLAEMEAEARAHLLQKSAQSRSRTKGADGWKSVQERDRFEELWAERDKHDKDFKLDSVLCEEALQSLDTAKASECGFWRRGSGAGVRRPGGTPHSRGRDHRGRGGPMARGRRRLMRVRLHWLVLSKRVGAGAG